jgi:hypothetical protein
MKTFNTILSLIPAILTGVVAIEQTLGNAVPGATKKQLVMSSLQIGAMIGETIDNKTVQGISALIDNTVTFLNQNRILGFQPSAPSGSEQMQASSPQVLVRPYISSVVK